MVWERRSDCDFEDVEGVLGDEPEGGGLKTLERGGRGEAEMEEPWSPCWLPGWLGLAVAEAGVGVYEVEDHPCLEFGTCVWLSWLLGGKSCLD